MKFFKLNLFVFGILCCAFIQTTKKPPLLIKVNHDQFTIDNIGNIYTMNDAELVKFLPSGKLFSKYSDLKLGRISSMDATNPLKLLLYYRDFQQIVFLDNQLSLNSDEVSLELLGYEQTELVCAGANNSFWIYDKQNNELIRFNEFSKKICSTGNLKQILRTEMAPNFMLEYNGYLYLNCPDNGIYVFDIFGAFSKIIALKDLKQFQANETIIYFQKDSLLCSYNFKLLEEGCKPVPHYRKESVVKYFNKKLYNGFKDSLVVQEF